MSSVTARAATDIRRAEPKDRDELVRLAADFATSFVVAESAFDRSLAEVLAHDDSALFVATVSGDVVGYI
jgi:hypothetical protein